MIRLKVKTLINFYRLIAYSFFKCFQTSEVDLSFPRDLYVHKRRIWALYDNFREFRWEIVGRPGSERVVLAPWNVQLFFYFKNERRKPCGKRLY